MMIFISHSFAYEGGYASWYGGKFQGRQTANGEIFDTYKFTAAHKNLPFNTMLKVVNLENGKSTVVRINDRGPFIEGRVLDLSYAAANKIGMLNEGVAKISYKIIESESTASSDRFDGKKKNYAVSATANKPAPKAIVTVAPVSYKVQVGSYKERENSVKIYMRLKDADIKGAVEKVTSSAGGEPIYRVVIKDVLEKSLPLVESNLKKAGFNDYLIKKIY